MGDEDEEARRMLDEDSMETEMVINETQVPHSTITAPPNPIPPSLYIIPSAMLDVPLATKPTANPHCHTTATTGYLAMPSDPSSLRGSPDVSVTFVRRVRTRADSMAIGSSSATT